MFKNKKIYMIPAVGFMALILFSGLLLKLPISNNNNLSFFDAIFMSTTAITGTGLTTINVANDLSLIGQIFLLLAVQIGALGFMIFFSILLFLRNKKIKLSDTLILSNEINFNNHSKVRERSFKIIKYTFFIEFLGAMLLSIIFVPQFGVIKGLWYGIFHSITAFCNSGLDIIGDSSLISYTSNIPLNVIIMILMFCGSIGYFVLEDICECIKNRKKHFQVYTKIILTASFLVIIFGTISIKIISPKITFLQALFLSISSRSTGFATFDLSTLSRANKLIVTILMFIGGASGSTAAGIRIINFVILVLLPIATIKNEEIVINYRKIDYQTIKKSITIVITYIFLVMIAFIILLISESQDTLDLLFELVSAFTTTGLSTFNVTTLSKFGQAILIFYMYIGRLGPITFLTLFAIKGKHNNSSISYPSVDVML